MRPPFPSMGAHHASLPSEKWAEISMQYIHHLRVCANAYLPTDLNSFVDKANYYSTHVVQNKHCALQENIVSKQLILYDQETTDQYAVDYKVLTV